ncbi:hypothetical protein R5R35_006283 [Gryllus longicercus]|uniref:Large ribosomal subunit protein mL50 n=1 Tax=Gryllus longicercus TaxID=2509291 RepID=A0AAN9ZIZ9_9ORTH
MILDNMAALMRHGFLKAGKGLKTLSDNTLMIVCNKSYRKKDAKSKEISGKTVIPPIKVDLEREYLRPFKNYDPPPDVEEQLAALCESILGPEYNRKEEIHHHSKFLLLNACFNVFSHGVPNSILHVIKSAEDILTFYKIKVDVSVPLEKMKKQDLPPNLHVIYDYVRFHPDTDTKFGGISAFPKSSTIVTGLKYKKKYQGHEAKKSWP